MALATIKGDFSKVSFNFFYFFNFFLSFLFGLGVLQSRLFAEARNHLKLQIEKSVH